MIRHCVNHLLFGSGGKNLYVHNWNKFLCRTNGIAKAFSSLYCTTPKTLVKDEMPIEDEIDDDLLNYQKTVTEKQEEWATQQLKNLSPEDERKLKILRLEYDSFDSLGKKIPKNVTNHQWVELLKSTSITARLKKYRFWMINEVRELKRQQIKLENIKKQEAKLAERKRMSEERDPNDISNLPFLLFLQEGTMLQHYYSNLCHAMIFGPHLVFDFGFEDTMSQIEITNLVSQIKAAHGLNKIHPDPYHIHMCNVNPDGGFHRQLLKHSGVNFSRIPLTVTEKHYLDFYPKEQLVYLSPNSNTIMKSYDPDTVYIIGGIVDKAKQEPLTFAKAKREGIKSAKLPLDFHLDWGQGSKSLSLIHMMGIMLTLRETGDWKQAFTHVPRRKLKPKVHSP